MFRYYQKRWKISDFRVPKTGIFWRKIRISQKVEDILNLLSDILYFRVSSTWKKNYSLLRLREILSFLGGRSDVIGFFSTQEIGSENSGRRFLFIKKNVFNGSNLLNDMLYPKIYSIWEKKFSFLRSREILSFFG